MLKFSDTSDTSEGPMKQPKLNMETLSKPDLLMLFSILEGELEARDLVIDALKSQHKDLYIQERYGRYNLSDPFLALQRDREAVGDQKKDAGRSSSTSNPLVVLKLVVSHCRRMQEKMLAQLAAAENRHRMVIADLEEEKRRHAEDTAEGDDVTFVLEKERERLQQQLEFERSQVRRLEKEQRRASDQLEEERAQHKQLSSALAKECTWASTRALEEGHRVAELGRKLEKEKEASQSLRQALEEEQRRALRMEARVEEQLAEFDTEREQLRSRLKKEEAHCCQLQREVEELKRRLEVKEEAIALVKADRKEEELYTVPLPKGRSEDVDLEGAGGLPHAQHKLNGHQSPAEAPSGARSDHTFPGPGAEAPAAQPAHTSLPAASSLSSPCSSPAAARRSAGVPGSYQASYQAGINQRFHAARHRFQVSADPEPQTCQPAATQDQPPPPGPPPPPPTEASPVMQQARSTVTQVLSRFTAPQKIPGAKLLSATSTSTSTAASSSSSSSPFGTDYRHLVAPLSPSMGRAAAGALPQGVRSPTVPRAERGNPPPIPPKKPGLAQAPASPAPVPRSASHFADAALSGSCGLTSGQEGVKELDLVVSSN